MDYSILQKVNVLHQNAKQAMAILRECVPNLQKGMCDLIVPNVNNRKVCVRHFTFQKMFHFICAKIFMHYYSLIKVTSYKFL